MLYLLIFINVNYNLYFTVISPAESIKNFPTNSRLNGWSLQLDSTTSELKQVEQNLKSLNRILDQLESNDNDVNYCFNYYYYYYYLYALVHTLLVKY